MLSEHNSLNKSPLIQFVFMQQLKCHFIRERKYSSFSLVHYSCVLLMKSLESERDGEKRGERERERERGEKVNSRRTKARKGRMP